MKVKIDVIGEKNRLSKSGELPLTIRLTQNKSRRYVRIGLEVKPEYWDEIRNRVKPNCPDREYIETVITSKLGEYQRKVMEFQSTGKEYSLNQLLEVVSKPTKDMTVTAYLNSIVETLVKQNHVGNAAHYKALLSSLQKFTKCSCLQFVDIDSSFLQRYEVHLRELGNKGNTISNVSSMFQ